MIYSQQRPTEENGKEQRSLVPGVRGKKTPPFGNCERSFTFHFHPTNDIQQHHHHATKRSEAKRNNTKGYGQRGTNKNKSLLKKSFRSHGDWDPFYFLTRRGGGGGGKRIDQWQTYVLYVRTYVSIGQKKKKALSRKVVFRKLKKMMEGGGG